MNITPSAISLQELDYCKRNERTRHTDLGLLVGCHLRRQTIKDNVNPGETNSTLAAQSFTSTVLYIDDAKQYRVN